MCRNCRRLSPASVPAAVQVHWKHTACDCLWLSAAAGGTGKKLKHVQLFKVPQAVTGTLETLPAAAGGSLLSIFCHAIQMNQ